MNFDDLDVLLERAVSSDGGGTHHVEVSDIAGDTALFNANNSLEVDSTPPGDSTGRAKINLGKAAADAQLIEDLCGISSDESFKKAVDHRLQKRKHLQKCLWHMAMSGQKLNNDKLSIYNRKFVYWLREKLDTGEI